MAPSLEAAIGESATFGAGCYWGTEKYFRKDFQKQFPGGTCYHKLSPSTYPRTLCERNRLNRVFLSHHVQR